MNSDKKQIDTICFGGEDWWYHNRGHIDFQLMRRFALSGTVLYINSIVMKKPNLGEGRMFFKRLIRKTKSIFTGLKKSDSGFWVYSPFTLPVHHLAWARPLNEMLLRYQIRYIVRKLCIDNPIVWIVCLTACNTAIKIKKSRLVYQRTDRHEDTPNVDARILRKYDRQLKNEADLTVYVNKALYNEEYNQCKRAMYLDHGVDYEMFASAEKKQDIPTDMANIKKPIAGYFGGISYHKFDVELMKKIINLLPEFSFVFVGDVPLDFHDRLNTENVWILGQKPYELIPHYGKCFDVAILPWKANKWTEAANPIKLKEYLALGKPIVSTPAFTELQHYLDVVYEANTPETFAESINKALKEDCSERIAARRKKVQDSSWDSKAERALRSICEEI
jgi:glycosyltransferase involved in cell wall biosynthesis